MATVSEALAIAVQHHQAGRLQAAGQIYRQVLAVEPNQPDAWHLLGVIARQEGKHDVAIECIARAIRLKGTDAVFHNNLGNALKDQGKLAEAVACYRRALELKPGFAEVHHNLGRAFQDQGKLDEAIACFRQALELNPGYAKAHHHLGNAFQSQGKRDEAVAAYGRALELKPDYAEAHNNLGVALQDQGRLDEAIACHRRALELQADLAEASSNLGNALRGQGNLDEAVACHRRALKLKPDYAEAHNNLGVVRQDQGRPEEAIACYNRALELRPDYADGHFNRSLTRLLTGDFEHGWPEYEWRWRTRDFAPRGFPQPLWDGAPLAGKTILLHAEQGLGDTIQFVRYASIVAQYEGTVILECQRPLLGLLEGCPGVAQLIGQGNTLPAFDTYAPLLSVPGILKTSLKTIPARIPYLLPKPVLLEQWRKRLIELDGFKIGISWQGSRAYRGDRLRSIPLPAFAALAQIPGVRLISLQKGSGTEQLAEVRHLFPVTDLAGELDEQSGPFMDTAAVMANLDLVIAPDTAAAHLAGALGVRVWLALPFAADWRWLVDRSDSPWYPTMRLFRQRERGDWQGLFEEIEQALRQRVQSSGTGRAN